eukprot:COSAG05_NODE_2998_length_2423_cov_36.645009_1_plen_102_part_00
MRDDAPWAFRVEIDTSQKGSMSRIQIGSGFQKKYILDPSTQEDKIKWQSIFGGKTSRKCVLLLIPAQQRACARHTRRTNTCLVSGRGDGVRKVARRMSIAK